MRPNSAHCAAPEQLVLPKAVPRVPAPFIAVLLAPFLWRLGRPDLFDSYAAGIILLQVGKGLENNRGHTTGLEADHGEWHSVSMLAWDACGTAVKPSTPPWPPSLPTTHVQMSIPQLRSAGSLKAFNKELAAADYDLDLWRRRSMRVQACDFEVLDANNQAGERTAGMHASVCF